MTHLLTLGPKHIFKPKNSRNKEFDSAFALYCRRFRLFYQFLHIPEDPNRSPHMYVPNPNFQPEPGPPSLSTYLNLTKLRLDEQLNIHPFKSVPPNPLIDFCKRTKDNHEIIITDSDKNLGPVILSTELYIQLVNNHLHESNTYKELIHSSEDIESLFEAYHLDICVAINNLDNNIKHQYRSCYKWLTLEMSKPFIVPKFRILPKLQKIGTLTSRPISGAIQWITTAPSKFVSFILQKYVELHQPPIIKDSKQFINFIENKVVSNNCLLVSFDIVSLYTSMDINHVITTFNSRFKHIKGFAHLIETILNGSFLQFNNLIFHQI